jgi:peptide subunit release factor 1 (eRF1)
VKLIQEKKLLQKYFDEISLDTGKYCFMVEDTLKGLELGAVETLIVWEGLETIRYTVRDNTTGEESVVHVAKEQQVNCSCVCVCVCLCRHEQSTTKSYSTSIHSPSTINDDQLIHT